MRSQGCGPTQIKGNSKCVVDQSFSKLNRPCLRIVASQGGDWPSMGENVQLTACSLSWNAPVLLQADPHAYKTETALVMIFTISYTVRSAQ